jgi:hypothetical protein
LGLTGMDKKGQRESGNGNVTFSVLP